MITRNLVIAVAAMVVLALCGAALAKEPNNPAFAAWSKFKPGAMARYAGNTKTMGLDSTVETTVRLASIAADRVTVEVTRKVSTQGDSVDEPSHKEEIPAQVPADQLAQMIGEEEIAAGGKNLRCKVYVRSRTEKDLTVTTRTWMNDEIPGGIVKVETKTDGPIAMSTQIELKEFKTQ